MIHISTEIFFNVISFVFHFERLISQKKILLLHISPEGCKKGFHPVYRNWIFLKWLIFSQKEIVFLSFCKSNFSYILECRFHFENLYCRRKFFWLTLQQKNLILYIMLDPSAEGIFLYFKMFSLDNPIYESHDKCGKLGRNPSAKNGLVNFLLGAMLLCSTPFSTSGQRSSRRI